MENNIPQGSTTSVAPSNLVVSCDTPPNYLEAALRWFKFGLAVIPVAPGTKQTAVKWDSWLDDLSPEKINQYWSRNPDHELGFIVGDDIIVFDADSPESIAALAEIENAFDVTPNFVVKTRKGVHHYFKRGNGSVAKTDSHSTEIYPARIDVKATRSMVILPPSTGKEIEIDDAENASELTEIGQEFIDAVAKHNGRDASRLFEAIASPRDTSRIPSTQDVARIVALIPYLKPDCGYRDWLNVLMAIFHETGGSEEGFDLADAWSSAGKTYKGAKEIRVKWNSFKSATSNPITIATLVKMAKENGMVSADSDAFELCETEVVQAAHQAQNKQPVKQSNSLDRYSLRGKSEEIAKRTLAEVLFLVIAILGQLTVIFAAPNTGKTLITLWMLIEAIKKGLIDPSRVYYVNVDDTANGLSGKLQLADEYGFHMLAEGYEKFEASMLVNLIEDLIKKDQARGVVIILDTLKKFTNLMDKTNASSFTKVARIFSTKGGTIIALAHINKKLGRDGKAIPTGTSDIRDDFDCAYILSQISSKDGCRVVEFENIKRRGNVALTAAYSYTIEQYVSYNEILLTIQPVSDTDIGPIKLAEAIMSDSEVIAAVTSCINDGINTKMKLADAVAVCAGISRRSALNIIEKYTGNDPVLHRWKFEVRERGAKVFVLLGQQATEQPSDVPDTQL